jgi:hypothetical protein
MRQTITAGTTSEVAWYRKLMKMWGESMIAGMEKKHVIDLTPKE